MEFNLIDEQWIPVRRRDGTQEPRKFKKEAKVLRITIGKHSFTESSEDINYLIKHFEIPDPGDLQNNHAEELDEIRELLLGLSQENNYEYADEQLEDLARCILKERALLGWSPGWGARLTGRRSTSRRAAPTCPASATAAVRRSTSAAPPQTPTMCTSTLRMTTPPTSARLPPRPPGR